MVRRFRSAGDNVVFTYRSNAEAARDLVAETGAHAVRAELTDAAEVRAAVAEALEAMGGIHVLVNNASMTQVMPFALIEEEDWDNIIAANLKSMFLVTREAARDMVARRSGVIVNLGSIAGHRLLEVPVHYATAKAGVMGFTTSLAAEFARYGIRVNTVVPGLLESGISRHVPAEQLEHYMSHCLAGRPGRMAEVADLVHYLASDSAAYVNAQHIFIDGGL
jgi:NAD(P)-dependent dehydrogenase (short-subunit alcohol dehydrogenase family)